MKCPECKSKMIFNSGFPTIYDKPGHDAAFVCPVCGLVETDYKKREITPHKGGRTKSLSIRVSPDIHDKIKRIAANHNITQADFIEMLIEDAIE